MEAKGKSLKFLCDVKILEVPFFQRPYVWEKDNWEELLNDLLKGDLQFLGSIIIKWQDKNKNRPKKGILVDGQQRLTTISILIKALYDCMEDERKNIGESARNALFYRVDEMTTEYVRSITHSGFDARAFKKVIGDVQNDLSILSCKEEIVKTPDNKLTKIEKCYKYFYFKLCNN